jgi:hypothetical protein
MVFCPSCRKSQGRPARFGRGREEPRPADEDEVWLRALEWVEEADEEAEEEDDLLDEEEWEE